MNRSPSAARLNGVASPSATHTREGGRYALSAISTPTTHRAAAYGASHSSRQRAQSREPSHMSRGGGGGGGGGYAGVGSPAGHGAGGTYIDGRASASMYGGGAASVSAYGGGHDGHLGRSTSVLPTQSVYSVMNAPTSQAHQRYEPVAAAAAYDDRLDADASRRRADETWVTVFGFPPSSATFVEQEFRMYGDIVQRASSATGNWLHLRYADPMAAKRALAKNASLLGDCILIGVALGVLPAAHGLDPDELRATGGAEGVGPGRPRIATRVLEEGIYQRREPERSFLQNALEYLFGW